MYRTLSFLIFLISFTCWSQLDPTKKYSVNTVAFYNVENLFDTVNDPKTNDDDRTPDGKDKWTDEIYKMKSQNIAKVISEIGKDIAVVESVKAASEVYSPVSGKIIESNGDLNLTPEIVNEDPVGKGWFYKIEISNNDELSELMSEDQYNEHIGD